MRRGLEMDSLQTRFAPGETIAEYLTAHSIIKKNVHQASYSDIYKEETTVPIIVNVLDGPLYMDAARAIQLTGFPSSMIILRERPLEEETFGVTAVAPTIIPPATTQCPCGHKFPRSGSQWRGQGHGKQQQWKNNLKTEISGIIQKELAAEKEADRPTKTRLKIRAQMAVTTSTEHGSFMIDSASHPTFLRQPPTRIFPLTIP